MKSDNSNEEYWKYYVSTLKIIAKEKDLNVEDIAAKSELIASTIKRIFDLKFEPPFEVFLKIADAVEAEVLYSEIDGQIEIHHIVPKRKPLE